MNRNLSELHVAMEDGIVDTANEVIQDHAKSIATDTSAKKPVKNKIRQQNKKSVKDAS